MKDLYKKIWRTSSSIYIQWTTTIPTRDSDFVFSIPYHRIRIAPKAALTSSCSKFRSNPIAGLYLTVEFIFFCRIYRITRRVAGLVGDSTTRAKVERWMSTNNLFSEKSTLTDMHIYVNYFWHPISHLYRLWNKNTASQ